MCLINKKHEVVDTCLQRGLQGAPLSLLMVTCLSTNDVGNGTPISILLSDLIRLKATVGLHLPLLGPGGEDGRVQLSEPSAPLQSVQSAAVP